LGWFFQCWGRGTGLADLLSVRPAAGNTPETPRPGYTEEGKRILGEQAIASKPEGSRWIWRNWLANTTLTFGINDIFDTRPPLSVDNVLSNFDNGSGTNFIQRYFWASIDKKF
jgi:hypothetical protein